MYTLFVFGFIHMYLFCVLQKKQVTKGGKKKKQVLKFTLDCTHPVEDGIMDAANFVSINRSSDAECMQNWKSPIRLPEQKAILGVLPNYTCKALFSGASNIWA